jgi:hypothetical protein
MTYSLQEAIDLLDSVAAGIYPSRAEIVHGLVALALHTKPDDLDVVLLIAGLEQFVFGHVEKVSPELAERAGPTASRLRHAVGVH